MKPPIELDQIAGMVLNYRPKPKSKASRKRAKKSAKLRPGLISLRLRQGMPPEKALSLKDLRR
jgi:hypothetical protein